MADRLSARRVRALLSYSAGSGSLRWRSTVGGKARRGQSAGTVARGGYIKVVIDGRQYSAGRLVWLHVHGTLPTKRVGYRDGRPGNLRLANLRLGERSQIIAHSKLRRDNASGLKGVCRERKTGKWMANANKNGRRYYLGLFNSKVAAHAAYVKAARRLHGDFARAK